MCMSGERDNRKATQSTGRVKSERQRSPAHVQLRDPETKRQGQRDREARIHSRDHLGTD